MTPRAASRWKQVPRLRAAGPALLLLLGFVLWDGADRTPSGPASGTRLEGTASTARPKSRLRLASFNIHGGVGADGQYDIARIGSQLQGFDLVGLNEVRDRSWSAPDQAADLGHLLNRQWLFAPAERRWWHDHFGNGLLTQLPVSTWLRIPLPTTQGKGFRNALLLTVPLADRDVRVLVTHIDRSHDREAQLRVVIDLFLSLAEPAVLLGDLNTTAADPQLSALLATTGVEDAVGPPDSDAVQRVRGAGADRIDWILARGLHRTDSGIEDRGTSDHPLVWAELAPAVRHARSK